MKFRGYEIDFNILKADDADKYESAAKRVQERAASLQAGGTLGDMIRTQCQIVYGFFDDLFGEGLRRELFPGGDDLMECFTVFGEFTDAVDAQKEPLNKMLAKVVKSGAPEVKSGAPGVKNGAPEAKSEAPEAGGKIPWRKLE